MGMSVKNSASKLGKGLDVRGDGGYIVAPPSQIGGKLYRWREAGAHIADMPNWIDPREGATKKSSSGAGVQEGHRNDSIFRLACRLRGEDVPYEDAEVEILFAAEACIPPLPTEEALRCLGSAYKFPAGVAIPEELYEMNKKHAVVMRGGKCSIMNHVTDPFTGSADINFSATADFKAFYGNKKISLDGANLKLADFWLEHPLRREYHGIVFSPEKDVPGYFNTWQGFPVKPMKGDCSLFLEHIRENISSGNADIYNYVVGWMADVVQNPSKLLGTSIVLRGKQGTGKGVLVNQFGALFGKHYVHLNNSKHLTGNFNAHLSEAILVFADEAFWAGDKGAEGSLKALITEPTQLMEKKGLDAVIVKNHVHLMVATNSAWAVPAGFEERRFLVLDVGDKRQQDTEFFKAVTYQMDNGGREALLELLLNYDLKGKDLRKLPQTKALLETKILSMSPVEKFWYEKLQNGALDNTKDDWHDGLIATSTFLADYSVFASGIGAKNRAFEVDFGRQIRKLVPEMEKVRHSVDGARPYFYEFPTLKECRAHFDKITRTETEWDLEGVAVKPVAQAAEDRINF